MSEKAVALVEEMKVEAVEVFKKHQKAMLVELNEKLTEKAIDVIAELIPGNIDNVVADIAKKPVKDGISALVEKI